MPKFTPAVVEFVYGFVIDDIQKVLKCSAADAKDVLQKACTKHVLNKTANHGKHYYKVKAPVLAPEKEGKPEKRLKGEYSNKNAWDKYDV